MSRAGGKSRAGIIGGADFGTTYWVGSDATRHEGNQVTPEPPPLWNEQKNWLPGPVGASKQRPGATPYGIFADADRTAL